MKVQTNYNSSQIERKWYEYWLKNNYFHSTPDDREPYTIVIPPPNITSKLFSLAILASKEMSIIFNIGLVGVSAQINFVLSLIKELIFKLFSIPTK